MVSEKKLRSITFIWTLVSILVIVLAVVGFRYLHFNQLTFKLVFLFGEALATLRIVLAILVIRWSDKPYNGYVRASIEQLVLLVLVVVFFHVFQIMFIHY